MLHRRSGQCVAVLQIDDPAFTRGDGAGSCVGGVGGEPVHEVVVMRWVVVDGRLLRVRPFRVAPRSRSWPPFRAS